VTDNPYQHYPSPEAIDAWLDGIWQEAQQTPFEAEVLNESGFTPRLGIRHMKGYTYVRFAPAGRDPFYGYWQPAHAAPAPLLVHTPGYGAEMSVHPDLVAQGYNVLHVNPLGYLTPSGPDLDKQVEGGWPVFQETLASGARTGGVGAGYGLWFQDCALAIRWALARPETLPDRVSFFGTSQGGGASLLLGSLYCGRGARCVAADEPWLTDLPRAMSLKPDWAERLRARIEPNPARVWRTLGTIDALSHVHRLTVPVLLTAGDTDATCPPPTIKALFDKLPTTRLYCHLDGQAHGYTREFIALATAWFRLYA
jgi:cephalosporin-C deacetylase-like acetyl esterase